MCTVFGHKQFNDVDVYSIKLAFGDLFQSRFQAFSQALQLPMLFGQTL